MWLLTTDLRKESVVRDNLNKINNNLSAFTLQEQLKMINLYSENIPDGLSEKLFHVISYELTFRIGEL